MIDFIKNIPIQEIIDEWVLHPNVTGLYDIDLSGKRNLHIPLDDFSVLAKESPKMNENTDNYKQYVYQAMDIANGNAFIYFILTHLMSVNLSKKLYYDLNYKPDISKYRKNLGTLTECYWYNLKQKEQNIYYSLFDAQWYKYKCTYSGKIELISDASLFYNKDKQDYVLDDNYWFTTNWYMVLKWLVNNGYLDNLHICLSPCDKTKFILYKTVDNKNDFYYVTNNQIEFDLTNTDQLNKFIGNIEEYIMNL